MPGSAKFAFHARVWRDALRGCKLVNVHRNKCAAQNAVLNRLRAGRATEADHHQVLEWCRRVGEPEAVLAKTNKKCDDYNRAYLAELPGKLAIFDEVRGAEWDRTLYPLAPMPTDAVAARVRSPRVPSAPDGELALKEGAVVIRTRNVYQFRQFEHFYDDELAADTRSSGGGVCALSGFNGQRGKIERIADGAASVLTIRWEPAGAFGPRVEQVVPSRYRFPQTVQVYDPIDAPSQKLFEQMKREFVAVGTTDQFALRVGFARTVHAAQGATITGALDVDLSGYAPNPRTGQFWDEDGKFVGVPDDSAAVVYVALSRATALENVCLMRRRRGVGVLLHELRADPDALAFDDAVPEA